SFLTSPFSLFPGTLLSQFSFFFSFHTPPTPQFYPLSLHDALPISAPRTRSRARRSSTPRRIDRRPRASARRAPARCARPTIDSTDRKSTRLNSSHVEISYAVFCLKKKKKRYQTNL